MGSNLGDRAQHLRAGLRALERLGRIEAVSTVYRTEPVGYREQPDFWNLVVRLATTMPPGALLEATSRIEEAEGRRRPFPNAPRTLDIDLLLYGDVVRDEPWLTLPHPRLKERAFVLAPLAELDPERTHPVTGERLADLAAAVGAAGVEPLFPGERLLLDDERTGLP